MEHLFGLALLGFMLLMVIWGMFLVATDWLVGPVMEAEAARVAAMSDIGKCAHEDAKNMRAWLVLIAVLGLIALAKGLA